MTKIFIERKKQRSRNNEDRARFLTEAVDPIIPADKHPDPSFIIIDKDKHKQFEKQLAYFKQMQTLKNNIIWPQHLTEVGKGGREEPPPKALSQIG